MYGYFYEREDGASVGYTDLACERRRADTELDGVEYKREVCSVGVWERIKICSEEGARSIRRPEGLYDTLNTCRMDLLDGESIEDAAEELSKELCHIVEESQIIPERILVIGLGNSALTPDSIGTETAKRVRATMHIKEFDPLFFERLECSEIAVAAPGVASVSGVDSFRVARALCREISPDAVIAIDALAARAVERLGTTVQICNTGIAPGSGLGNSSAELTKESLGVPVIGIGVPTVIDTRAFLKSEWGDSAENERKRSSAMFVSPKEINEITEVAADIISKGINSAFGIIL